MFIPIIEADNKKLVLQNFLFVTDVSTEKKSKAIATARGGVVIEFNNEDAEEIAEQLEQLLEMSDKMQLPIVGIGNQVFMLFNFLMVEDASDDETARAILTDDAGEDQEFTGTNAALILSRMDTLAQGTKAILLRLQSGVENAGNN